MIEIVIKNNGAKEKFTASKIRTAVSKAGRRAGVRVTDTLIEDIISRLNSVDSTATVEEIHLRVIEALRELSPKIADSYFEYREFKKTVGKDLYDKLEDKAQSIIDEVDRENSNTNSRYISTKRTSIAREYAKALYEKLYLSPDIIKAKNDGYIYIHDLADMILPQYNCALIDMGRILDGGFTIEGIKMVEPKDIRTAIGQLGDVLQIISAQHFGGATIPEIDKVLSKYYLKTIAKEIDNIEETLKITNVFSETNRNAKDNIYEIARERAYDQLKQSLQGLEAQFNTVVSARGSYPFTSLSFGDVEDGLQADICKAILEVRMEGHGEVGFKKNLIFPKLIFLYNPESHEVGKKYEWLFNLAVDCSSKCMYPDFLSPKYHKREGKFISPMGEQFSPTFLNSSKRGV